MLARSRRRVGGPYSCGMSHRRVALPHSWEVRARGLPTRPLTAQKSLRLLGELNSEGWARSLAAAQPVDRDGQPLPWWTYSSIYWLTVSLSGADSVFEYGSGYSTLWLAGRVKSVQSVEHDRSWAEKVRERLPSNATVLLAEGDAEYVDAIRDASPVPDVVVVDGIRRPDCLELAGQFVRPDGLIILDDSDRGEYHASAEGLVHAGFGRVDFWGPRPASAVLSVTSVFTRDLKRWSGAPTR